MSYLGLISVCPPREGSMAAGPSPTLDRPLLGSSLYPELSLPRLLSFPLTLTLWLAPNVIAYLVELKETVCGERAHSSLEK